VLAQVVTTEEARCVVPAGAAGVVDVEVSTFGSTSDELVAASTSTRPYKYVSISDIKVIQPAEGYTMGGDTVVVGVFGFPKRSACVCSFDTVFVACETATREAVTCRVPAMAAGNHSFAVATAFENVPSVSGGYVVNDFVMYEPVNVSTVTPSVVALGGGTSVLFSVAGMEQGRTPYCAVGGVEQDAGAWAYTTATMVSSTQASCTAPARGAGMHVLEVAMAYNGEMSHSGVQVEYVFPGTVSEIWPSQGAEAGGTLVTMTGTEFVAGRTACKFGAAAAVEAMVTSSSEATCVAPAAARGDVNFEVLALVDGVEIPAQSAVYNTFTYKQQTKTSFSALTDKKGGCVNARTPRDGLPSCFVDISEPTAALKRAGDALDKILTLPL